MIKKPEKERENMEIKDIFT